MGFIDWIRKIIGFFRKKDIQQKQVDKIVSLADEGKALDDAGEKKPKQEAITEAGPKTIVIESENNDSTNFIQIDIKKLELERIEREAETISSYSKLMARNIAHYRDSRTDSNLDGIVKKYKMIFIHSMELKNLLAGVSELFYNYLLHNLSESNVLKEEIEKGQKRLIEIIGMLAKAGFYDELFNPEKASNYKKNIDEAADKGEFAKELEAMSRELLDINNRKTGVSASVNSIAEKIKESLKNDKQEKL